MNKAVTTLITQRIRAEYLEMPGLSLKPEQVQRLCGVDSTVCKYVLKALIESGFLSQRADGAYGRYRHADISRGQETATLTDLTAVTVRTRWRAS